MATPTKSIFDGMEYLYAEQLKGKRVTLTIKEVELKEIIGDGETPGEVDLPPWKYTDTTGMEEIKLPAETMNANELDLIP